MRPRTGPASLDLVALKKRFIRRTILSWASRNLRSFPWRDERTSYAILVAELLLRRTTATAVLQVYSEFLRKFATPAALASARPADLEKILRRVGYHRVRTVQFQETARAIVERFGGVLPRDYLTLQELPHIGPYTAGAIVSLAVGRPAVMVDSNVMRVLSRVFADSDIGQRAIRSESLTRKIAEQLLPPDRHRTFNLGLIDLGATICLPRKPRCPHCPLLVICDHGRNVVPI